ncbi:dienelactone hydrolase family protein [Sphingomonas qomolangmaensis]|uniref:Dienelactone hydrolase family protein n=1 Tax=Sphingomonas qomolangmaensis TaxID=2918765 RepID=A0ABY5LB60_9SPHN|nr:dienelactone hydrolase family protein [Sphingomonas qomolangmaensis]UUL82893.1 dienelactone hydrolase family protein [Sphingomonas qomolangmaensis]
MTDLRQRAIDLYDAFTHEHRDRRQLLRETALLVGSVAAAEALIATIAASPAAAQQIAADDPRLVTETKTGVEAGKPFTAYFAAPRQAARNAGYVLVVHENRGLNAHIKDVARRVALAGYRAIAPDFLAPQGGTPADEDQARALIGTLDYDLALAQAVATAQRMKRDTSGARVGAVGFCWGGAFVNRLAVAAGQALDAGASYYGPAPAPTEAAKVRAAMVVHLAGKDARVNATGVPWGEALKAAGRGEAFVYPEVDHAFNNDTSAARYDKSAADLAWSRTLALFAKHLDG